MTFLREICHEYVLMTGMEINAGYKVKLERPIKYQSTYSKYLCESVVLIEI